jgi:hypothetical protein
MAGDRYEERLSMRTDRLHGDVIAGMSAYHERDHELVTPGTEVPVYRPAGSGWPADELASLGAGDDDELTGDQRAQLLQAAWTADGITAVYDCIDMEC